jgi:hypothetical protein
MVGFKKIFSMKKSAENWLFKNRSTDFLVEGKLNNF